MQDAPRERDFGEYQIMPVEIIQEASTSAEKERNDSYRDNGAKKSWRLTI